jgi:hypothetical protein
MAVFAAIFFVLYFVIGNIIWIVVLFRLNFMYAISLIWQKKKSNEFRDIAQDYSRKHFQMFGEILKLPFYVWKDLDIDDQENRNMIREVLVAEWQILNKNWEINIFILLGMLYSFFKILTFVGLLSFDSSTEYDINSPQATASHTIQTVEKIVYANQVELNIAKGTTRLILVVLITLFLYFVFKFFEFGGEDMVAIVGGLTSLILLLVLLYNCYLYFDAHKIMDILF